jgi:hypothetical protein
MSPLRRTFAYVAPAAAALGIGLATGAAKAACNIPPDPNPTFRGAIGTLDRSFARAGGSPGDFVAAGSTCGSPPLNDANQDGEKNGKDYFVTVVFKAPQGGRNVVVVRHNQICHATSCEDGQFSCVSGSDEVSVVPGKVRFRFPDTDRWFEGPDDDRTFTGPAAIAVTPVGGAVPCELASKRCEELAAGTHFACVDDLFEAGTCGTNPTDRHGTFASFTGLPPVNDYQEICHDAYGFATACKDAPKEVRLTIDQAGNLALPMRWTNALDKKKGKKRRLWGSSSIHAKNSVPSPISVPGKTFLSSFTTVGTQFGDGPELDSKLPENLPPPVPPQAQRPHEFVISGYADEDESVLWFWRHRPWRYQCDGGTNAGQACENAPDCPGNDTTCEEQTASRYFRCVNGTHPDRPCTRKGQCGVGGTCEPCTGNQPCGSGLFDFSDRLAGGVGPIVLPKEGTIEQPGVCRGGPKNSQSCTSDAMCESHKCVVYRAEADGYK